MIPFMLVMADSVFSFRLLNENPVQRLGATGATEVSYLLTTYKLQIMILLHKRQL